MLIKEQLVEIAQELGSNWKVFEQEKNKCQLINDQNIVLSFYFVDDGKLKIYPVTYQHPIYPKLEDFNFNLTLKDYSIKTTFKNPKWVASNIKRRLLPNLLPEFEKAVSNWEKYQEKVNQSENEAYQIQKEFPQLVVSKDIGYTALSDKSVGITVKCLSGNTFNLEVQGYKDFSLDSVIQVLKIIYSIQDEVK